MKLSSLVPVVCACLLVGAVATGQETPAQTQAGAGQTTPGSQQMAAPQAVPRQLTEANIRQAVERKLTRRPGLKNVRAEVQPNRLVVLTGNVQSLVQKEQAADLARMVRGVREVKNQINVQVAERPDSEILAAVQRALKAEPAVAANKIEAEVKQGKVVLTGNVRTLAEKELAAAEVRRVRGVREIDNQLKVQPAKQVGDEELTKKVQQRLRADRRVDEGMLEVAVENGVVTLTGTVASAAEKQRAIAAARVQGVTEVKAEQLQVQEEARQKMRAQKKRALTEQEISQAVQTNLADNPQVPEGKIQADVTSNVVTLTGTVDTRRAKRAAGQAARDAVGVREVKNQIKVQAAQQGAAQPDAAQQQATVDPQQLTQEIKARFADNWALGDEDLDVTIRGNTAVVEGEVDDYGEKWEAEDILAGIPGITDVENQLTVDAAGIAAPDDYVYDYDYYDPYYYDWYYYPYGYYYRPYTYWDFETPEDLRESIQSGYFWSPFVDGTDITITVKEGNKVELTGVVDDWDEYGTAIENAYEGGATDVTANLTVLDTEYEPI